MVLVDTAAGGYTDSITEGMRAILGGAAEQHEGGTGEKEPPVAPVQNIGMTQAKANVRSYADSGRLNITLDEVYATIDALPESPEKAAAMEKLEVLGGASEGRDVKKKAKDLLEAMEALPAA